MSEYLRTYCNNCYFARLVNGRYYCSNIESDLYSTRCDTLKTPCGLHVCGTNPKNSNTIQTTPTQLKQAKIILELRHQIKRLQDDNLRVKKARDEYSSICKDLKRENKELRKLLKETK